MRFKIRAALATISAKKCIEFWPDIREIIKIFYAGVRFQILNLSQVNICL